MRGIAFLWIAFVALGLWAFSAISEGLALASFYFGWTGFLAWVAFPLPFAAYVLVWAWRRWREPLQRN
jgi:hypothetical protein